MLPDLIFAWLPNGLFTLEQYDGAGETIAIAVSPDQVPWIAKHAGMWPLPDPGLAERLSARHERQVRMLIERIRDLWDGYRDEIFDRCGAAVEIALHFRALDDLAEEILVDLEHAGNASPPPSCPGQPSNGKAVAISVTPPQRGRPASGEALTNAERQARHREKHAAGGLFPNITDDAAPAAKTDAATTSEAMAG